MTLEEFAIKKVEELKRNLNSYQKVAKEILEVTVNDKPISQEQIRQVLDWMDEELGDYGHIKENFDNTATLSLMQKLRQEIIKTQQKSGSNGDK